MTRVGVDRDAINFLVAPDVEPTGATLRIAFIGNSFIYFNDLPHLVKHLLQGSIDNGSVEVGACLRGGASLVNLWQKGANMVDEVHIGGRDMYPTVKSLLLSPLGWDVVILQDYSQGPARPGARREAMHVLRNKYLPLLLDMKTGTPLVVMYQTWGYLRHAKNSEEIGDFDAMTERLLQGYLKYQALLEEGGVEVVAAAAGLAFQKAQRAVPNLWRQMYQPDDFHPRAVASFLNGAHIAAAVARSRRFAPRFPHGLRITPTWPAGVQLFRSDPMPNDADLAALLEAAGPEAWRDT